MLRLRQLAALCLCLLWLPATLHCDLHAADLLGLQECHGETAAACSDAHDDACIVVESGWIKRAPTTIAVAAPTLCACLFCVVQLTAPDALPPSPALNDTASAPPEIARTWHFVARAAPPPRAPSLLS